MVSEIIFLAIAIAVFLAVYFTKKRFGLLMLGTCVGYLLAELLAIDFAMLFSAFNLDQGAAQMIAKIFLITAPVIVLSVQKVKYKNKLVRLMGSIFFASFFTIVILSIVGNGLEFTISPDIWEFAIDNSHLVIAAGIVIGIVDFLAIDMSGHKKK